MTNLIAAAIPLFLSLIALEYLWARKMNRPVYRLADFFSSVGCGTAQQAFGIGLKVLTVGLYSKVQERFGLFDLQPHQTGTWLIALIGFDLAYYCWHRASHRVNWIWAAHGVHHQSQDYNLGVALRQAMFGATTSIFFDLGLAFLGVPAPVYLTSQALNLLYQFWICWHDR